MSADDPVDIAAKNLYVDSRLNVQVGMQESWLSRIKGAIPFGGGGYKSSFAVENTNLNDQIVAQFWSNDNLDDGSESTVLFVTSGDSSRPNSRNVGITIHALNWMGLSTGIRVRMHGWNGNKNRGIDITLEAGCDGYAIYVTNPDLGDDAHPVFSVDRRGRITSEQMTEVMQRIARLEEKAHLDTSTSWWWRFFGKPDPTVPAYR